jgi:autotransporter-associated beta strand protein
MKNLSNLIVWPLLLASFSVTAQTTLYWDPGLTGDTNGGGAGTWSTAANWYNGTSDTTWTAGDIASFGGATVGTVTLGANETADGVTFTTTGYTISGTTTLTLGGATPIITLPSGGTETVSAKVGGSAGLAISGSGTLVLSGANTYTGGTAIPAGATLKATAIAGAGTGTVVITGNGIFTVAVTSGTLANAITGGSTSVVNLDIPSAANILLSGSYAGFTGTINCVAGGTADAVVVEAAGPLAMPAGGTWNIASGATLDLNVGSGVDNATVIINGPGGSGNFGALRMDNVTQVGPVILAGTGNNNQIGGANTATVTISGVISDNGLGNGLNRWGDGNAGSFNDTIVLSAQNTYSGATTLSYATLRLGSAENAGVSGPLGKSPSSNPGNIIFNAPGVNNGGTLQFSSANQFDYSGRFSIAASQGYNIDVNGQTVTFATALTSSGGALTVKDTAGGGTLVLSAANTYTGTTTLSNGTVQLAVAENAGTSGPLGLSAAANPGAVVLRGGSLQFTSVNQNDYSGRFSTSAGQGYNIDVNGQTVTFATALTSSGGALTLKNSTGNGKLILTATETYTGTTTVNSGTLDISASSSLAGGGNVTVNGGTLELDGISTLTSNTVLTLASSPAAGSVNLHYTGTQRVGQLKFGTVLQPYGTYGAIGSGAANQNAAFIGSGILNSQPVIYPQSYWDPNNLDASPGSGGSGNWDSSTVDWWVTGTSDTTWTANDVANFTNAPGIVTMNAGETANGLTFGVDNYTIVGTNTLTLGGGTPLITIPSDGGTTTISAPLAASSELSISGAGTLVLGGTNAYSVGTVVGPGTTLEITNSGGAGAGTVFLSSNSTFTVTFPATGTLTNAISGGSNSVVNIDIPFSANTFLTGSLSGFTGTINCIAGGPAESVVVENANPLTIPAGATWNIAQGATLDLNAGGVDAATVVITGPGGSANYGALRLDSGTQAGPVVLATGGDNQIGNASTGGTSIISGVISDGGNGYGIDRVGFPPVTNTIVLSGQNTYSGTTTLTSNTLQVASAEHPGVSGPLGMSAASNPGSIIFVGGILQYSSSNQFDYSGRFSTTTAQPWRIDVNGQSVTFATALSSGGGTLTLQDTKGGGTLVLTAANTYDGGTTVNSGTLDITNTGSVVGSITINAGRLELDNTAALVSSAILYLPSTPAAGTVYLNFSGTQTISTLILGTTIQAAGTYGAVGSGAANTSATFTGSGILNVAASTFPQAYWDPNGNNASPGSGGSGSWDSGSLDWWVSGSSDTVWTSGDIANFAGTSGIADVNANETANGLNFITTNYSLQGGGILTLGGFAPTVTVPAGVTTISTALAGSAGLTSSGPGTLLLTTSNAYTGPTTINPSNTLQITALGAVGSGTVAINGNGTFCINVSTATANPGVANAISGASNSAVQIEELGVNTFISGNLGVFNGTIYCLSNSPPGGPGGATVVEATGPLALPPNATWNIAAGATLDFNAGADTQSASVVINGPGSIGNFGALRLDSIVEAGNILLAGSGISNQIGNAGGGNSVSTINGVISDGGLGHGFTRIGVAAAGNVDTIVLAAENTYSGGTILSNGILQVDSAEIPGTSGPLGKSPAANPGNIFFENTPVLNPGILQYSSANQFDYSGRFGTDTNEQYYIDVNGQSVTFATPLTSSGGSLTLKDSKGGGTLVLSGVSTYDGGTTINSGTLDVNNTGMIAGDVTNNAGTLELDNASALSYGATLVVATPGATVNLNFPGTQYIAALYVGGAQQAPGIYGTSANNPSTVFTGSGTLNVGGTPPARITSATIANHQLTVSWASVPGTNYNIIVTTNLAPPTTWTLLNSSPIPSQGTSTTYTLPGNTSTNKQLFLEIEQ